MLVMASNIQSGPLYIAWRSFSVGVGYINRLTFRVRESQASQVGRSQQSWCQTLLPQKAKIYPVVMSKQLLKMATCSNSSH